MTNKDVKKYTVKDFCKKYNGADAVQTKETYVKSIMNPHYIPYEIKITVCENIVKSAYYKKDDNGNRKLYINSPIQYMLYRLELVRQYTNIEVDFSNVIDEFNLLNKSELFDEIIVNIPNRELNEFEMVLDMVKDDAIKNEYETHAFISNQVERFGQLIGVVLKPAFEQLSKNLENMDEKTIDKMVDKVKGLNGLKGKFNFIK